MVRSEFHGCTSIKQYLAVAAAKEGYRSPRELFCNYLENFGYTIGEFKLHMEYRHKVFYSVSSYRSARYRLARRIKKRKKPQLIGWEYDISYPDMINECERRLLPKYRGLYEDITTFDTSQRSAEYIGRWILERARLGGQK